MLKIHLVLTKSCKYLFLVNADNKGMSFYPLNESKGCQMLNIHQTKQIDSDKSIKQNQRMLTIYQTKLMYVDYPSNKTN